jgi:hypothetical protein
VSAPGARAEANPPGGTDFKPVLGWSHQTTQTAAAISATVPPHGVVLYRVTLQS